jgi:hypothetical protein
MTGSPSALVLRSPRARVVFDPQPAVDPIISSESPDGNAAPKRKADRVYDPVHGVDTETASKARFAPPRLDQMQDKSKGRRTPTASKQLNSTRRLAKGLTIVVALIGIGIAGAGCTGTNARGGTANNTPANILRPHGTTTPSTGTAGDTP